MKKAIVVKKTKMKEIIENETTKEKIFPVDEQGQARKSAQKSGTRPKEGDMAMICFHATDIIEPDLWIAIESDEVSLKLTKIIPPPSSPVVIAPPPSPPSPSPPLHQKQSDDHEQQEGPAKKKKKKEEEEEEEEIVEQTPELHSPMATPMYFDMLKQQQQQQQEQQEELVPMQLSSLVDEMLQKLQDQF